MRTYTIKGNTISWRGNLSYEDSAGSYSLGDRDIELEYYEKEGLCELRAYIPGDDQDEGEVEQIGVTVKYGVLEDYDGCATLPYPVIILLEHLGINVGRIRDEEAESSPKWVEAPLQDYICLVEDGDVDGYTRVCPICGVEQSEELHEWGQVEYRQIHLCGDCHRAEAEMLYLGIERMAEAYEEKQSDVSEALYELLHGRPFEPNFVSARFITATLPQDAGGKKVQYDTLTTQFSIYNEGQVGADTPDCEYTD